MRVTITGGGRRLHWSLLFTVWSLLQLMRRHPGRVPDVDLMFDCMDRPAVNRTEHGAGDPAAPPPPPLFRYCTTRDHFDIPFPDWSFWGWYGLLLIYSTPRRSAIIELNTLQYLKQYWTF